MTDEEAEAKWRRDKKNKDVYREYEGNVMVIAVRKPTEIVGEESMSIGGTVTMEKGKVDKGKMRNLSKAMGSADFSLPEFQGLGGGALNTPACRGKVCCERGGICSLKLVEAAEIKQENTFLQYKKK